MQLHHTLPKGAVTHRILPTKRALPVSSVVDGAFVHTIVLTRQRVNVIVRMHVQVRSLLRMHTTRKWFVSVLKTDGMELHLLLTPAPKDAKPNIGKITLDSVETKDRSRTVRFEQIQLMPLMRRVRRAEHEQSRVFT